jgi:hypothetical protein
MSYVVGANRIDVIDTDRACLVVCPVDGAFGGERKTYITATECGASEPEFPVDATFVDRKARDDENKAVLVMDSMKFFKESLPGVMPRWATQVGRALPGKTRYRYHPRRRVRSEVGPVVYAASIMGSTRG